MRIECRSLRDFLQNLELESDQSLFRNAVWVDVSRHHQNGRSSRDPDATSFLIMFQAAAIVQDSESQYLVCVGEDCGIDRMTADGTKGASEAAESLLNRLSEFCQEKGFVMRPGNIDLS